MFLIDICCCVISKYAEFKIINVSKQFAKKKQKPNSSAMLNLLHVTESHRFRYKIFTFAERIMNTK